MFQNQSIIIGTVYRPENNRVEFWDRLEHSIGTALDSTPHVIITGDLNIDFMGPLPYKVNNTLLLYNLQNVIDEPTRVTEHSSTCIDPILISDTVAYVETGTVEVTPSISDHHGTYIVLNISTPIYKSFKRNVWVYKNADYESMKNDIAEIDWPSMFDTDDIDTAVMLFGRKLTDLAKEHIPRKTVTVRPSDRPWFNSDIRREIRTRDRLRKAYRRTHKQSDLTKYKRQRNKVNNMKTKLKEQYYDSMNESLHNLKRTDSKTYWKLIRSLIKGANPPCDIPALAYNNELAHTDDGKCDMFNEYFCSVTNLDDSNHNLPPFDQRTDSRLDNAVITEQEITEIIKLLDPKKASGPDDFSHILLQNVCTELSVPLKLLFNKSIALGKFPKQWKHAHVLPIFKKGDKSSPTNYRPISLLSCIGKVFERVMFKYIYNHLHSNSLLYDLQSGFRPGQSTVTQLIEIYHQICVAIDHRDYACFTFCDISKAFDRVWLKGLIYKLEKYGFSGNILSWLSDYLTDRTQQVKLKSSISTVRKVMAGVPQGSVLGPLLFLVYINDLPDGLHGLTRLFADDTSNSHVSNDLQTIEHDNNLDLDLIKNWSDKWLVQFNPKKTNIVIFAGNNIPLDNTGINFQFDGEPIVPSLTHKHLGVVFSNDAKWSAHIEYIASRISKQISVLRKLKYTINREFLSRIYLTFIRPILEYGSEVWDNLSLQDAERLEKFQIEAARIVTGLPIYCSRASLYFETGWDTLKNRRHKKKLCLMYKIQHGMVPDYLTELFPDNVGNNSRYNLRNSYNIAQPFCRLNLLKSSFVPSTISAWNNLPLSTRNAPNLTQFRSKLIGQTTVRSSFYGHGDRKLNIIHTRLRHGCSLLNNDLYRINLVNTKLCPCGDGTEDAKHYFLRCSRYNVHRDVLFDTISQLGCTPNIGTILYGDQDKNVRCNEQIFQAVHKYIARSKRFT